MTAANEKPVTESLEALIERMRLLETDHTPDGWPAVRMREISALCDEIERRFGIGGELIAARRELDDLRHWITVSASKLKHAASLLENDGDEYGVGKDIRDVLAAALPQTAEAVDDAEYTQGLAYDGVVILKDGQPITIDEVLAMLNARARGGK